MMQLVPWAGCLAACLILTQPVIAHGGQVGGGIAYTPKSAAMGAVTAPTGAGSLLGSPGGASSGLPASAARSGGQTAGRSSRNAGRNSAQTSGSPGIGQAPGDTDASFGPDSGSWELWWLHNHDRFLALRSRLVKRTTVTGSVGALTGRGRRVNSNLSYRPGASAVDGRVLPTLLGLLESDDNRDILDSAALAAARSASELTRDQVLSALKPQLANRFISVQSSTALSLGALDHEGARGLLKSLVRDDSSGRRLAGGKVPELTRAFAALSLGLAGRPSDAIMLADIVRRTPDRERDVKLCSIIALGLLGAHDSVGSGVSSVLLDLLADRRLDPGIRSHVPTALARAGDRSVLPDFLAAFVDRDADRRVRQSLAIAMGRLATPDDPAIVAALLRCVEKGRDASTRHFALIALGEIGGRGGKDSEASVAILDALLREVDARGSSRQDRSWGALAAALYGRGEVFTQPRILEHVRLAYRQEDDPAFKGAFAIALGLLGDRASADEIDADFVDIRSEIFRGHAAVAMGLLDYTDVALRLRALCSDKGTSSRLRIEAAMGLGLLADRGSIPVLIAELESNPPLGVVAGMAKALGLIGDDAAIEPLGQLAKDESQSSLSRAFACVALGLLGARSELPFQTRILAHENYLTDSVALAELKDIL